MSRDLEIFNTFHSLSLVLAHLLASAPWSSECPFSLLLPLQLRTRVKKCMQPCWLVPVKTDDLQHGACPEITANHKPPAFFNSPPLILTTCLWTDDGLPSVQRKSRPVGRTVSTFDLVVVGISMTLKSFTFFLQSHEKVTSLKPRIKFLLCSAYVFIQTPLTHPPCPSCLGMSKKKPIESIESFEGPYSVKYTWIFDVSISPCLSLLHRNMPIALLLKKQKGTVNPVGDSFFLVSNCFSQSHM